MQKKKIQCFLLTVCLTVGALFPIQSLVSARRAEAGVIIGAVWWENSYRRGLVEICQDSVNSPKAQPWRFLWYGTWCALGSILGDEDNAQSATSYLSADHPYVAKGVKTEGGVKVKYSEEARRFHNDHRDDFVDAAEAAREALNEYRVKDGGVTTDELLRDFKALIVKSLKEIGEDQEFNSPAGKEALQNFIALQFNTSVEKKSKVKRSKKTKK